MRRIEMRPIEPWVRARCGPYLNGFEVHDGGPGAPFDGTGEELTITSVQIYFSSMTVR